MSAITLLLNLAHLVRQQIFFTGIIESMVCGKPISPQEVLHTLLFINIMHDHNYTSRFVKTRQNIASLN